jgi:hypothetical protein
LPVSFSTPIAKTAIIYVMPQGVEHSPVSTGEKRTLAMNTYVMPQGVEHT